MITKCCRIIMILPHGKGEGDVNEGVTIRSHDDEI